MLPKIFGLLGLTANNPLLTPLLKIPGGGVLTIKDAHTGIGLLASSGAGKTVALSGISSGLLGLGQGGMVLAVKPSVPDEFAALVERAGRNNDLHILTGTNGKCLDCFDGLSPSDAADLLVSLYPLALRQTPGNEGEPYWPLERNRLTLCLCELSVALHGRISPQNLVDLLRSLPNNAASLQDPFWRESSITWRAMEKIEKSGTRNARVSMEALRKDTTELHERTQKTIRGMVTALLDTLLRSPFHEMFCDAPTVTPAQIFNEGKLVVVGIASQSSFEGVLTNAIAQFVFCRFAKANKPKADSFLISDECQETISDELTSSLLVLREHRVSCILATQHLGALDARLGPGGGERLLDSLGTLIFMGQSSDSTRRWASARIGEKRRSVPGSNGEKIEWVPRVPPMVFEGLKIGESITYRRPDFWRASWSINPAGALFKVRVPHARCKAAKR